MGFNKISALSLTDLFVQQIENMILSGELAVGEQLPPARELSIRMGDGEGCFGTVCRMIPAGLLLSVKGEEAHEQRKNMDCGS